MTRSVSVAHLKAHLAEAIDEVRNRNSSIVIERHGKPVAMLVPVAPGHARGVLGFLGAFDDEPELADVLEDVVRSRQTDRRRRVPGLR